MKRNTLLTLLLGIVIKSYCQPQIINPTFPNSVGLFDLFEVSFTMNCTYLNPYDPNVISIYGLFTAPDNTTYKVDAFYYEDYTFQKVNVGNNYYEDVLDSLNNVGWRIRFTPTCTGNWKFRIIAKDANGAIGQMPNYGSRDYRFECTSVENADGFITTANSKYLKRDIVKNGQRQYRSFFPIGLDIAWYDCLDYGSFTLPKGIYEYQNYIDSLYGNANYMRVFINRYQGLSLYGPEFTQRENGGTKMYFDSSINQKDSAELDYIITYALQHGVSIMLCVFTCEDFKSVNMEPLSPSKWSNNPYHTNLGLTDPCYFFTNNDAILITKNLIRYIVSRWGYATNIMSWEFWNEVDHMFCNCDDINNVEQNVQEWHEEMVEYLHRIDPFHHCVSSSMGSGNDYPYLSSVLYDSLDFVQRHNYENIQNAESRHQLSFRLYNKVVQNYTQHPSKPYFFGEFGFAQDQGIPLYENKDPYGIDLHNSLWSSLFFTTMGAASFWWWPYTNSQGLYHHFTPLLNFSENMPILSESFTACHTGERIDHSVVFPNNLETYYMINATQDTIYGWSQDTAFAYQSLRWLTDSVHIEQTIWGPICRFKIGAVYDSQGYVYTLLPSKKPVPSSNSNTITLPITNQPIGSRYLVKWYNSETGEAFNAGVITYAFVQQDMQGNKHISFEFPNYIRNPQNQTINNKLGDAVFVLVLNNIPQKTENNSNNSKN
jgi:hypothetical protein